MTATDLIDGTTGTGAGGGTEHLDVVIIGAGISGIGAAYYLQREHPQRSYAVLEARGGTGGTWDLFRYPGIRSDSDLHTFGYDFKPWSDDAAIAPADKILSYLRETATEFGIDPHVRLHNKVVGASWSSADARWTIEIEHADTGARSTVTANWIFSAGGYYRYDEGFTPHFEGRERFRGTVVHPQQWPEDLDYAGKKVVVIGSGATAVTLVPSMCDDAEHVTMLQRTPTYIIPLSSEDVVANTLRRVFGERISHPVARTKNIIRQQIMFQLCQRFPRLMRRAILRINKRLLPKGYPVETHFNPPYDPWDQRLCVVPNGDLFRAIRGGKASVVTERIAAFDETGIRLESGGHLEADIIITATGLNVQPFGGVPLTVDGREIDLHQTRAYKGFMLSGVPNLAFAIGYTNSSWTLKIGMLCEHFCRLLGLMDARGADTVVPEAPEGMPTRPFLDFAAGYIQRAVDELPQQGDRAPWLTSMSYWADVKLLRKSPVEDDENLRMSAAGDRSGTAAAERATA
ncbi:flavin-containing monooxygenase [Tomitella fengzijianii]|uniref:NAD(P)/FAD-dependent oxidoreductase n=1 Tax=Tomitella fengzijianii TaxID=2597660 RepID=A0A516WZ82_9ACTN|nr:NAD(P)/FAD-dependent oxidoreductase [Tomitella fengzijianii]QDQ96060.1 NAD(P)/FAD-dependent oxidoreductase [Tomitella fengzijianii]